MNNEDFGRFFARIRKESGFKSQRQLAAAANISNATVARIEDGSRRPKPETLKILSNHLKDVSYTDLLQRAGYLDNLTKHERESEVGKNALMEYTEDFFEDIVKSLSKDLMFLPNVRDKVQATIKQFNLDEEIYSNPDNLLLLYKNSVDIEFKINLYDAFIEIYNSSIEGKKQYQHKSQNQVDKKKIEKIKDPYTIVYYINKPDDLSLNYEIVDSRLLKDRPGFAMRVDDNSMSNDGIYEGDTIICVNKKYISESDLAIVEVYDEILIRRIKYIESDSCLLLASNPRIEPEIVNSDYIEIIGKVVQLRRNIE